MVYASFKLCVDEFGGERVGHSHGDADPEVTRSNNTHTRARSLARAHQL